MFLFVNFIFLKYFHFQIDLAKTMAEMFKVADKNKDDVMDLKEFQNGVMEHPITAKIFRIKKIDALLDIMAV